MRDLRLHTPKLSSSDRLPEFPVSAQQVLLILKSKLVVRGGFRRLLPTILMIVGAGLLLYVSSQYVTMYVEQRKLEKRWVRQNSTSLRPKAHVLSVSDDGLTRVLIPKINLDAIVVEGTGRKQLLLGPGHLAHTPEPGEIGNSVITGHRDTFFRHIYELNKGDNIEVRRNGSLYTYEVTGKKVVNPEDLTVLLQQTDDKRLTLITCYPIYYIGPAPDRLVVFAKLSDKPLGRAVSQTGAIAAGAAK